MTYGQVLALGRDAILVAFYATGPVLILGMVTGLVVSLFQSVTQLQEPTLTFIPKMLAAGLAVLLFGPFMLAELTDFTTRVFLSLGTFIR